MSQLLILKISSTLLGVHSVNLWVYAILSLTFLSLQFHHLYDEDYVILSKVPLHILLLDVSSVDSHWHPWPACMPHYRSKQKGMVPTLWLGPRPGSSSLQAVFHFRRTGPGHTQGRGICPRRSYGWSYGQKCILSQAL